MINLNSCPEQCALYDILYLATTSIHNFCIPSVGIISMASRIPSHSPIFDTLNDPRNQIRLLTLAPSSNHDADICCCLEAFEPHCSTMPEYEAISYVWGELSPTFDITINNQPFKVSGNLQTALRYIRDHSAPRKLWIDALCINQSDNAEKHHQICQMDSIYTRASDVLIWLGEADESIDKALVLLKELESRIDAAKLDWYLDSYAFSNDDEAQEAIGWHGPVCQDESVHPGMKRLFTNPWFGRMWVVQEASLSRRSPIVLCGETSLSFKMLWNLRHNLALPTAFGETVRRAVGLDEFAREEAIHFPARWSRNGSLLSHDEDGLLAQLLKTTWRRKCTDPRDKIFAILGFMTSDYVQTNFPDYNESVEKIYQRAMKLLLKRSGIYWLQFAKAKSMRDLPSWCIDFSSKWVENDWGWTSELEGPFTSDVSKQLHLEYVHEPDVITVNGVNLGRVCLTVQHLKQMSLPNSLHEYMKCCVDFSSAISPFFSAVYSTLQTQHSDETAMLVMRRGHVWNLICHGEKKLNEHYRDIMHWALKLEIFLWVVDPAWRIISKPWSQVPMVLTETQLKAIELGYMDKVLAKLIPVDPDLSECGQQLTWVISQLSESSFFVTSDPSMVVFGKADGLVEEGDELFLLDGYPAPSVLRAKQKSFKIVGFAWCYEDAVHYEHSKEKNLVMDRRFTVPNGRENGGFRLSGWRLPKNDEKRRSAWEHVKTRKTETLRLI
jgi:hypothetical protein